MYGTSDTSYVEKVSSTLSTNTMEVVKYDKDNKSSDMDNIVVTDVAKVLGMSVIEEETYSLVFGEELSNFDIVYKSKDNEEVLNEKFEELHELTIAELGDSTLIEIPDEETLRKEAEAKAEEERQAKLKEIQSTALLEISNPDENYVGTTVKLSDADRKLLERLVQGEAGGEGLEGAALVAQAIRDTMVYKGFDSVEEVRRALKYSGSTAKEPNQDVKKAVAYIFDDGGCAVKHSIFYFYAPKRVSSAFHESQKFIIEHGGHRFFSVNK